MCLLGGGPPLGGHDRILGSRSRECPVPERAIENPIFRDKLIVLVGARDSGGELFRFEYIARAASPPPPDHVHMEQEERVEVLEGTIRCRIGGEERMLGPGDTVTIPRGVYHAVWSSDPAGSRSVGEFRPALKMQEIFEAAFAAD